MRLTLPEEAYAASLAGLPVLRPDRLRWLLAKGNGVPSEAWHRVAEGGLGDGPFSRTVRSKWKTAARHPDPGALLERYRAFGVRVLVPGMGAYPARLAEDPERPAVVFVKGAMGALDAPSAGVVGTRSATGYGREAAVMFGRDLARAGVAVVSGLAAGVDVAAHRGALRTEPDGAPVVAVVGTGLDFVYPASSRPVWEAVGRRGLLVSEAPLGSPPSAWRFPARNRIMAALSDVVLVVESHAKGGALITVEHAQRLGRSVLAAPGPVTSPASAGSNSLLADGALVARDSADVLVALGLDPARRHRGTPRRAAGGVGRGGSDRPPAGDATVWDQVDMTPTTMEQLIVRTGRRPGELAVALSRLEAGGWVQAGAGWWSRTSTRT